MLLTVMSVRANEQEKSGKCDMLLQIFAAAL